MDSEMAKREIEFASEADARSLGVLFNLGKDLEQVVLCACFQTISGMRPFQESIA
jgi:hypothetical protein